MTLHLLSFPLPFPDFNSHARVGRDLIHTTADILTFRISTHTPAWGVTYAWTVGENAGVNFNSHARVGRDAGTPAKKSNGVAFQLTRPRGA